MSWVFSSPHVRRSIAHPQRWRGSASSTRHDSRRDCVPTLLDQGCTSSSAPHVELDLLEDAYSDVELTREMMVV